MIYSSPSAVSPIDTSRCSPASYIFWIVQTATKLGLADYELTDQWYTGHLNDRELLENIRAHGGWPDVESMVSEHWQTAAHLSACINNLLTGMMLHELGNVDLQR